MCGIDGLFFLWIVVLWIQYLSNFMVVIDFFEVLFEGLIGLFFDVVVYFVVLLDVVDLWFYVLVSIEQILFGDVVIGLCSLVMLNCIVYDDDGIIVDVIVVVYGEVLFLLMRLF